MALDTHMTKTCEEADVIIPGSGFASVTGTFTNTERRLQKVNAAIDEGVQLSNYEVAAEIAKVYEVDFGFDDTFDISREMKDRLPKYKSAKLGEIQGGVLTPVNPQFVVVGDAKFVDIHECSDNLMNVINDRLPKQVKNPNSIKSSNSKELVYNA